MDPIPVDTPDVYSVLHPTDFSDASRVAFAHALRITLAVQGRIDILHVDTEDQTDWDELSKPQLTIPSNTPWEWELEIVSGEPIESIIACARRASAGLIAMATDGRDGFLDGLRGSHSERVLRHAHCPVLIIPEGSRWNQIAS